MHTVPNKRPRTKSSMPLAIRTEPDGGQCFHFSIDTATPIFPSFDLNAFAHPPDLAVPTPAYLLTFDAIKLLQWETDTVRTGSARYDRFGMDVWDTRFVTEHPSGVLQIYGRRLTSVLIRTGNLGFGGGQCLCALPQHSQHHGLKSA